MRKIVWTALLIAFTALSSRAQSGIVGNLNAASTDCSKTNSCITISVPENVGGATLKLSGTFSATVQFEATADPLSIAASAANWVAISATPSSSTTTATSATSGGAWQINVAAYRRVRVRVSAYTSGTVAAAINLSTASARGGGGGGSGTVTASGTLTSGAVIIGQGTTVIAADSGCSTDGTGNMTCASFIAPLFKTSTANPASAGTIRLANIDKLEWRNTTNASNILLGPSGAATGNLPADLLNYSGTAGFSGAFFTEGNSATATTGIIRMQSASTGVCWRNAANGADLCFTTTAGDIFTLAAPLSITASGGVAGGVTCTAGTAIGHATASTITLECPAAATAYERVLPGTSATGILHLANSGNVDTESISAVALGGADVSGTLTVPNGGTGLTTLTSNVIYKGNTASALAVSSCTDDATTLTCTDTGGIKGTAFTSTGTTAGFADYPQGTTSAAVAPCNVATSICEQAPTSVTSYLVTKPGVSANGITTNNVAAAVITQGISGDANHSATVTTGSGTSVGSTTLCSSANCPAGTYMVNVYIDVTTACGTTGTYVVNLIYTDDQGAKTIPVNINGTGAVPATGVLTTTSTANFGENSQVIRLTSGNLNYSTTAVACGSAGPMVGKLYMAAVPVM